MKIQEIILVAGKNKSYVCQLRRFLKELGYNSIPCKSVEQIIQEREILLSCDAAIPLIIIEPEILNDINKDSIETIINIALDIPFVLANIENSANLAGIFDEIHKHRIISRRNQNDELVTSLRTRGFQVIYS